MNDRDFLRWIFDRLVNVHGENPNYDYMRRLREIIDPPSTAASPAAASPAEVRHERILNGDRAEDPSEPDEDAYDAWAESHGAPR